MMTSREFDKVISVLDLDDKVVLSLKKDVQPIFDFNDYMMKKLNLNEDEYDQFNIEKAKNFEDNIKKELFEFYSTQTKETLEERSSYLEEKEDDIILKYMKLPVLDLCEEYSYEHKEELNNSLDKILPFLLKAYKTLAPINKSAD